MAIPDLTSYVVLNPKFTGLGQQLQLARCLLQLSLYFFICFEILLGMCNDSLNSCIFL